MKRGVKKYLTFVALLAVLVFWIIILSKFAPSEIIVKLGVRNTYIILFLIAAIGGSSLITSSSYYIVIPILAVAGLNPLLLGLFGGVGLTIGDSIYFYLGSKGKEASPEKFDRKLERIHKFIEGRPKWFTTTFIYVYAGFTPLPNDVMTFFLGLSGYSYKKMILPLVIGNMTGSMILAYLGIFGINFF